MGKRRDPKRIAEEIAAAERRAKVLDLKKARASFRAIGAQLGVSDEQARQDFKQALAELQGDETLSAGELRQAETESLDMAALAIARQVQAGHLGAIDRWVRISESRRKLWGIDGPITHEISIKDLSDEQLRAYAIEKGYRVVLPPAPGSRPASE